MRYQTPRHFRATGAGCRRALAALLTAGLSVSGCYQYVPIQLATVRPQEDVLIRVSESAAARLVEDLGAYTTELGGRVATMASDSVSVSVMIGRNYRGMILDSVSQTLSLGRSEVVEIRRRQLSRSRTVITSAGALAAFGLLVGSVIQWGDPNPGSDEPPPPAPGLRPSMRAPIR